MACDCGGICDKISAKTSPAKVMRAGEGNLNGSQYGEANKYLLQRQRCNPIRSGGSTRFVQIQMRGEKYDERKVANWFGCDQMLARGNVRFGGFEILK